LVQIELAQRRTALENLLFRFPTGSAEYKNVARLHAMALLAEIDVAELADQSIVPAIELPLIPGIPIAILLFAGVVPVLAHPFWTIVLTSIVGGLAVALIHGFPGLGQSWAEFDMRTVGAISITFAALSPFLFPGLFNMLINHWIAGSLFSLSTLMLAIPPFAIAFAGHAVWNTYVPKRYRLSNESVWPVIVATLVAGIAAATAIALRYLKHVSRRQADPVPSLETDEIEPAIDPFIATREAAAKRLESVLKRLFGESVQISLPESFMVGDSAYKKAQNGKPGDMRPDGRPGFNFSNSDRLFAENLGIRFLEP
jgi:hypothetical protein